MLNLSALFLCSLTAFFTPDLTGHWSGSAAFEGRQIPLVFELVQDGSTITGTCGLRPDFMTPIKAARLTGESIEIDFQLATSPPITLAGTLQADTITGEAKLPVKPFTAKFEMKRTGPIAKLPASLATAPTSDDLAPLSDEFESVGSLKNWKNLSETEGGPNRIEKIEAAGGNLTIVPLSGAWWAGYHGIYLFKEVKGDFAITTRLEVTGKETEEPSRIWTISGLLLRKPADPQTSRDQAKENWIYLMTGRGPATERVIDAKSTVDSNNQWDITPAKAGWHELRVARLGPLFVALIRPEGGAWAIRKRILREDLPETIQAGINVTSDFDVSRTMPAVKYNGELFPESKTDGLTMFDYVRFGRISGGRLAGRDLLRITDAELLAVLQ